MTTRKKFHTYELWIYPGERKRERWGYKLTSTEPDIKKIKLTTNLLQVWQPHGIFFFFKFHSNSGRSTVDSLCNCALFIILIFLAAPKFILSLAVNNSCQMSESFFYLIFYFLP